MFLKWIKMGIPPFEENLYPSSARIVLERSNALKVGLDKCSCDAVAEAGFLGHILSHSIKKCQKCRLGQWLAQHDLIACISSCGFTPQVQYIRLASKIGHPSKKECMFHISPRRWPWHGVPLDKVDQTRAMQSFSSNTFSSASSWSTRWDPFAGLLASSLPGRSRS